jgi:hypothetical protein
LCDWRGRILWTGSRKVCTPGWGHWLQVWQLFFESRCGLRLSGAVGAHIGHLTKPAGDFDVGRQYIKFESGLIQATG